MRADGKKTGRGMLPLFSLFLFLFTFAAGCGFPCRLSSQCSTTRYVVSFSLSARILRLVDALVGERQGEIELPSAVVFPATAASTPLFSSVVAHFLSPFFIHPNFDLPKKQVIWQVVNHGHCTFKVKTLKQV